MTTFKKCVGLMGLLGLMVISAAASDINKGYTFSPGEHNVTHTKLNNLVDQATIDVSFITGKPAAAPVSGDSLLFYSASGAGFRKADYASFILNQTNLIINQTELNTPPTNAYVLLQTPAGAFAKSSLNSLIWTNSSLINDRTNWPTPNRTTTFLLAYDNGNYSKVSPSNLLYQFYEYNVFTNQLTNATPLSNDRLLIFDWVNGTNKQISLAGLVTNATPATLVTNGDFFWGYSTNEARVVSYTMQQIRNATALRFQTGGVAVAAGQLVNGAHGLPGTPQSVRWVLQCISTDAGYAVGDEVDVGSFYLIVALTDQRPPAFSGGANASNVFLICDTTSGISTKNKGTGVGGSITTAKWNAKCYATYFQ